MFRTPRSCLVLTLFVTALLVSPGRVSAAPDELHYEIFHDASALETKGAHVTSGADTAVSLNCQWIVTTDQNRIVLHDGWLREQLATFEKQGVRGLQVADDRRVFYVTREGVGCVDLAKTDPGGETSGKEKWEVSLGGPVDGISFHEKQNTLLVRGKVKESWLISAADGKILGKAPERNAFFCLKGRSIAAESREGIQIYPARGYGKRGKVIKNTTRDKLVAGTDDGVVVSRRRSFHAVSKSGKSRELRSDENGGDVTFHLTPEGLLALRKQETTPRFSLALLRGRQFKSARVIWLDADNAPPENRRNRFRLHPTEDVVYCLSPLGVRVLDYRPDRPAVEHPERRGEEWQWVEGHGLQFVNHGRVWSWPLHEDRAATPKPLHTLPPGARVFSSSTRQLLYRHVNSWYLLDRETLQAREVELPEAHRTRPPFHLTDSTRFLRVVDHGKQVRYLWDMEKGVEGPRSAQAFVGTFVITHGNHLVTDREGGGLTCRTLGGSGKAWDLDLPGINSVSRDGKYVAHPSGIYELATGEKVLSLGGEENPVAILDLDGRPGALLTPAISAQKNWSIVDADGQPHKLVFSQGATPADQIKMISPRGDFIISGLKFYARVDGK